MDHPRIAAVISAAAASTAAFVVVKHWGLLGTVAGAAVIPIICTLLTHWLSTGLDGTAKWLRANIFKYGKVGESNCVKQDRPEAGPDGSTRSQSANERAPLVSSSRGSRVAKPRVSLPRVQWALLGPVVAALALSIYAVADSPREETMQTVETVVIERIVVEEPVEVESAEDGQTLVALNPGGSAARAATKDVSTDQPSDTLAPASTTETEVSATDVSTPASSEDGQGAGAGADGAGSSPGEAGGETATETTVAPSTEKSDGGSDTATTVDPARTDLQEGSSPPTSP